MGALIGAALAVVIAIVPMTVAGDGFYEATDPLVTFLTVLVPLGAVIGAVRASLRAHRYTKRSGARAVLTLVGLALVLALLWLVWALMTGTAGL